ncbi:nucleotidyltransferase substrate binding protein [Sphingomonas sp. 1P08PE]|uniref:nucleotidyltransferase substrate binding protein n=1 Tax=Sphingomonas sp. 1P08PE TaxID=554122 RepID=UPI0039A32E6C
MAEDSPSVGERPRWRYRFDNYHRAFVLLREAMELLAERSLTPLEREGIIQRFEYSWELAWKTLADFLVHQGIMVPAVSPRTVLRAAYESGFVTRGEDWMAALDARNKMSHTYDLRQFEAVIVQIRERFFSLFEELHDMLLSEAVRTDAGSD